MSDKRFKLIKPLGTRLGLKDIFIKDTQEDYYYNTKEAVVDLLNEQQAEIEQLKDDVYDELDKALKVLEEIYEDYPKNNVHRLYNNLKGLKEMME